ncbi:MAG TPA: hypothetical protein VHT31_00015, partial [Candidatus Acidoferrum sp.]|nr:hypothetical protein [Candidatus Acidoferrum sp.]
MKLAVLFSLLLSSGLAPAQSDSSKPVTVPLIVDHNRVVIEVSLPLADGSNQRVRAWVDNGNPVLYLSRRAATLMGLAVACGENECTAPPPREITISGIKIPLTALKEAKIPLKSVSASAIVAPGMNVEINIPSTILRNYDVLINYPDHEFTIGPPGSVKFRGIKAKVTVNAESGLVQVPSLIENKKYNLALDLGSSISFLSGELFGKLAAAHRDWPHMTGAIGPANLWGLEDEPKWKLMRVDRVQYGPLFLTHVVAAALPEAGLPEVGLPFLEAKNRGGISSAGLLGSEALMNYRIGLDYAHSAVYFEIGRTFNFPDFDIVGLILRPEDDGRFTVLAIADYDGKASVTEVQAGDRLIAVDGIPVRGSTLGQVLLMLG